MQLKSLDCQSEIGFLSLFEYYKSCSVSQYIVLYELLCVLVIKTLGIVVYWNTNHLLVNFRLSDVHA